MVRCKVRQKTGKNKSHFQLSRLKQSGFLAGVVGFFLFSASVFAGKVQFTAQVDQRKISIQDTVSLSLTLKSESGVRLSEPQFDAPDFDIVHEFSSTSISSVYNSSGGLTTESQNQITKVLRPKAGLLQNQKEATVKISNIHVNVEGNEVRAEPISIQVVAEGSMPSYQQNPGPSQPQQPFQPFQGFQNPRLGRRPPAPQQQQNQRDVGTRAMVRAEVDKQTAYKGEQIVVSYYLYRQMKIFNIQVEKFPMLSGFLREDLDIPVMGQRLESEPVTLNGLPFERSLLARYAAYPLKEGKLSIDSMSLKFNYYTNSKTNPFDEDDPFFGFFQQLAPKAASSQNDKITVDVLPLPNAGRPESFTGGVGQFNLTSAIDKYEVRANEALTLMVKVDGQGNISTLQDPKIKWPDDLEIYDSKSRISKDHGGLGEKIFEFLIIPRRPGKVTLPPLEFGFFDPIKKEYYVKSTPPAEITVKDPAPGSALVPVTPKSLSKNVSAPTAAVHSKEIRPIKASIVEPIREGMLWQPAWRFLYWACSLVFFFLVGLISFDSLKKYQRRIRIRRLGSLKGSRAWEKLLEYSQDALKGSPWTDVVQAYDQLNLLLLDEIDKAFRVGAKSVSRNQLKQLLVEDRGLSNDLWERIQKILEFADWVRFASTSGGDIETLARNDLSRRIMEVEVIIRELSTQRERSARSPSP